MRAVGFADADGDGDAATLSDSVSADALQVGPTCARGLEPPTQGTLWYSVVLWGTQGYSGVLWGARGLEPPTQYPHSAEADYPVAHTPVLTQPLSRKRRARRHY